MRLDTATRKAKQRELRLRQRVEAPLATSRSEQRVSYYRDAEECGHLAHVTEIVDGRCRRCVGLMARDGNGNLVA